MKTVLVIAVCALLNVFDLINLNYPGLEKVKAAVEAGNMKAASAELLSYYRAKTPVRIPDLDLCNVKASELDFKKANDALGHTFYVHDDYQPSLNYGKDINWEYWPVKEIEIRVQLHRHPWWTPMGRVYRATSDERYAEEYVYEYRDWVKKNPYSKFDSSQKGSISSGDIAIDAPNVFFCWRPLEIGIRLATQVEQFELFLPSKAFTPAFLTEFLSSYHHNASVLMETFSPKGNHRLYQAQGIIYAAIVFPEFKDAAKWLETGVNILNEDLGKQVFPDGCQYEYDPQYQYGILEIYAGALRIAALNGLADKFPSACRDLYQKMLHYFIDYTYPDGVAPSFSDNDRMPFSKIENVFKGAVEIFPQDQVLRWFATRGAEGKEPSYKTSGYPSSGFYTFRSGWGEDDIVMAVKATKRGMWHAQPDFGTFELWNAGHTLIPDAGSYVYAGDEETMRWRRYFKNTARHSVLTLDNADYIDPEPEVLAWRKDGKYPYLWVGHKAYDGLYHRRAIFFVENKWFIIVDDVDGPATGTLDLRFCMGEERLIIDPTYRMALYLADPGKDIGLKMVCQTPVGTRMRVDKDWYSPQFRIKRERQVVVFETPREAGAGRQVYTTVLHPINGNRFVALCVRNVEVTDSLVKITYRVDGDTRTVTASLK